MSLNIYIGKNKVGKTFLLKNKEKNWKEHGKKTLFLSEEITFFQYFSKHKDLKTELINEKNIILNFIKEISQEVLINEEEISFWINNFKQDIGIENSYYEILKYLNFAIISLSKKDIKKKIMKNFHIIIEEPAKFSHPELIYKIADLLYNLSSFINLYITTYSIELFERILQLDLNNNNLEVNYFYQYRKINEFYAPIELDLKANIDRFNFRRIRNIVKILFSSNVILYEGVADETFIESIISQETFKNQYITLIDCNGKGDVLQYARTIQNLNLIDKINILMFYDSDSDKNNSLNFDVPKGIKSIIQEPNIEKEFFDWNIKSIKRKTKIIEEEVIQFQQKNSNQIINKLKKELNLSVNNIINCSTKKDVNLIIDKKIKILDDWINSKN